ncbi:hypothetical protein, partial [Salmonella sp. M9-3]|uniref:hypothetical protein n=1 Tax=Salmonella sp. M9-3 TaxID=3240318 RepID=UPI00352BACFF
SLQIGVARLIYRSLRRSSNAVFTATFLVFALSLVGLILGSVNELWNGRIKRGCACLIGALGLWGAWGFIAFACGAG